MRKEEEHKIAINIIQFLFALILLTMICFSFVGCGTIKEVPINNIEKIVYKDTTIYLRDSVFVPVPVEKIIEIVPQDTTSILRTSVALSEAKVENGTLTHKLEQKGTIPVQIDTVITVQYVDRIVEREIPVEVEVTMYKRDTIYWFSIIFNVIVLLITGFKIYLKLKK